MTESISAQVAKLESDLATERAAREAAERRAEEAERQRHDVIDRWDRRVADWSRQRDGMAAECERLRGEVEKRDLMLKELFQARDSRDETIADLRFDLAKREERVRERIEAASADRNAQREINETLSAQYGRVQQERDRLRDELTAVRAEHDAANTVVARELADLRDELDRARLREAAELAGCNGCAKLRADVARLTAELGELRQAALVRSDQLGEQQRTIERLTAELARCAELADKWERNLSGNVNRCGQQLRSALRPPAEASHTPKGSEAVPLDPPSNSPNSSDGCGEDASDDPIAHLLEAQRTGVAPLKPPAAPVREFGRVEVGAERYECMIDKADGVREYNPPMMAIGIRESARRLATLERWTGDVADRVNALADAVERQQKEDK